MRNLCCVTAAVLAASAGSALGQITPIGPFTGSLQESFAVIGQWPPAGPCTFCATIPDAFGTGVCTLESITGANIHVTGGWGFMCSIGQHATPRISASTGGGGYDYHFSPGNGVLQFGGYFGTNCGVPNGTAEFYDIANVLIGSQPLTVPADCSWNWHGWSFTTPVYRVRIIGNYSGGGYIQMDDMEASTGPAGPTGACCLLDGSCLLVSGTTCTALNGTYRGDGTDCATANCPQPPTGACCVSAGCVTATSAQCTAQNGTYRGDGTNCATANCPQPCPPITGQLIVGPSTWPSTHVVQSSRLFRDGVPDTCAVSAPGGAPIVANYDADVYNFVNTSASPACVVFTFSTGGDCNLYGSAYIGGYDPNNVALNNVASTGSSTGIPPAAIGMSFTVPGSTAFQIVVNDTNAQGVSTCANSYTFQISGGTFNCTPGGPTCYPNCDHSTSAPCLNVTDFGCFLNAFAANDPYANCDGSTTIPLLTVQDFGCFLNAFAAGCGTNC